MLQDFRFPFFNHQTVFQMYWDKTLAWWNLMLNSSLNKALILFLKCKHGTHFLPYISVAIVGYCISTVQDPKVGFSWHASGLLHLPIKNEALWLSLQSAQSNKMHPGWYTEYHLETPDYQKTPFFSLTILCAPPRKDGDDIETCWGFTHTSWGCIKIYSFGEKITEFQFHLQN